MLIRKLVRTARQYKSPFISMVLMIAIGVGVFLGFNMEWKSLEVNAFAFLDDTRYADYRLYSETGFTADEAAAVAAIDGVEAATRYLYVAVGVKGTDAALALNVSENYTVSTMLVTSGAAYDGDTAGLWLSDKFADAHDIHIGDELTLTYTGTEITDTVVGLAKSGENMICVADSNQLMPDYDAFGFAYIAPQTLERALGTAFYPQIHIRSAMTKEALEEAVRQATGTTVLVTEKDNHVAYAGVMSESEEGQTMGSILPVLFLAIAVLTMVTTMHRIAANEKGQIGTLKALGFRDRRILRHYTSYGFAIGLLGIVLGVLLGYFVVALIISPHGMMATYVDMPTWNLVMPRFCLPMMGLLLALLTLISYLSVRNMLKGTAADALRPYTPRAMRQTAVERLPLWRRLPFGTKWNLRDILRHRSRSAMTLLGVMGCTVLLVGRLGMQDTMERFVEMLDRDTGHYATKISLTKSATTEEALAIAQAVLGDWQATGGVSYEGQTVSLEIYQAAQQHIRFLTERNRPLTLGDDGVYLCLRLKDTASVGDTITFSPYGSSRTYTATVAGYTRSLMSECIVMSAAYADRIGVDYRIGAIYTDTPTGDIPSHSAIASTQDKQKIMDSYDTFMELMNLMVLILVLAAMVLGVVVLYTLGVMSYVERQRELATLKILGFRNHAIGRLLISQNLWLTVLGVLLGIPAGVGVLQWLLVSLAGEYELSLTVRPSTYILSIALTFGVSLLVDAMVAAKNKHIDMVEALKGAE